MNKRDKMLTHPEFMLKNQGDIKRNHERNE